MASIVATKLKKADRTRQTLLEAALRVIGRKGYTSATVDEIAKEAGVSKGLAYYHFKSKADMASGILTKGIGDMADEFELIVKSSADAAAALTAMLDSFASMLYDNREFARFLMAELWRDGRVWSGEMREKAQALIDIISTQLSRGQAEGTLNAGANAEFAAVSIVGMVVSDAMYYAGMEGSPLLDKQAFCERIRAFARHALT